MAINMSLINKPYKILIDYNDIIFKNKHALKHLNNRSTLFVSKKLNISYSEGVKIDKITNKTVGHTVTFLNNSGIKTTLEEYNEFVYDHIDWGAFKSHIKNSDYDPLIDIHLLNEFQKTQKCILFTNSPRIWVDNTLELLSTSSYTLFDDMVICQDTEELKPNDHMYDQIQKKYPGEELLLIDNSFLSVTGRGRYWRAYLHKHDDTIFTSAQKLINDMGYEFSDDIALNNILYPDADNLDLDLDIR